MYYIEDKDQMVIEDFAMPFGGKLDPKNRWVRLARIMPWDQIEEIYLRTMSTETGRRAFSSRIVFGSIYIKESENLTDESCVTAIQENPYMQYFLGLHEFQQAPLFDPSMMVHFRKRFPVEDVARINEYVCTGKWPEDVRNEDCNDNAPSAQSDDTSDDNNNQDDNILLNQAATNRAELVRLLNISRSQMGHITNAPAGHGLLRVGGSIVPFANDFPRDGDLYRLMTTTPGDK